MSGGGGEENRASGSFYPVALALEGVGWQGNALVGLGLVELSPVNRVALFVKLGEAGEYLLSIGMFGI